MKKTVEIIFTYRPFEWKKPISWINRITRKISKSPYDHISIKKEGWVYESTAGIGVHKIKWSDWVKGREGTTVQVHQAPNHAFNWMIFQELNGRPYDYRSAILHVFKAKRRMRKRAMKAFTCSEFVGAMMNQPNFWELLPSDIKEICNKRKYPLYEIELV